MGLCNSEVLRPISEEPANANDARPHGTRLGEYDVVNFTNRIFLEVLNVQAHLCSVPEIR